MTAGLRSCGFSVSWKLAFGGFFVASESLVKGSGNSGKGGDSVSQVPQCALLKLGFFHTIQLYPRRTFSLPLLLVRPVQEEVALWGSCPAISHLTSDLFTSQSF